MQKRTKTDYIVVHVSDTKPSMDFVDVDWIRNIHVNERGWADIGYHFIIKRDGTIQTGRQEDAVGAHERSRNRDSIGVCLVGGLSEDNKPEFNILPEQLSSLKSLICALQLQYGGRLNVAGHNQFNSHKTCPNFYVPDWFNYGNITEVLEPLKKPV